MKMNKVKVFLTVMVAVAAVSCAKEGTINDTTTVYDRVLKSWVTVNYPAKVEETTDSGAYVLEFDKGTGISPTDTSYVFVHYVWTDLEGNISSTNVEEVQRQIRSYSIANYYGSDIWRLGEETIPSGIEEALLEMNVGGKAKLAVPIEASYLTTALYNAFDATAQEDNFIFKMVLDTLLEDINAYQLQCMADYRDIKYPGLDTTSEGFYFKKLVEVERPDEDEDDLPDSITDGTTVYVKYIARRVADGGVFDTNIQDTAKKYRIYSSENEYGYLDLSFYNDEEEMISNNSGTIEGFSKIVCRMYYGEQAVGFFWSDLGYGEAGSDETIPEYAPLEFTIWMYEEEED